MTQDTGVARVRTESDLIGALDIAADAYWGVHTQRALENFQISGSTVGQFPELVRALVSVKQAAARTNCSLGKLAPAKAAAIEAACGRILSDAAFNRQFVVDPIQGGAGTSTNMNANEVVANVALEHIGRPKGDYHALHPNDDVNMSQSTNDVYPTALRLAVLFTMPALIAALHGLAAAFRAKAAEFSGVLKIGRTQLQDAVPMTLGQEFNAFATTIEEDIDRLGEVAILFREVNLGATAIGTGITADPRYPALVIGELARITGQPLLQAPNLIEATSDTGAFVSFSSALKRVAVKLSKIASDLRLLTSGPRAGLGEIRLPTVQAGSSIMPGKINPVIPEVVNQVAYLIIGHDLTVTMCAEGGQLQLNAFEPTIGYCILASLRSLTAAVTTLTTRCVTGIEADRERCFAMARDSIGLATALVPVLGYEAASRIAKRALAERRMVADVALEEGLLTPDRLDALLDVAAMTNPLRSEP